MVCAVYVILSPMRVHVTACVCVCAGDRRCVGRVIAVLYVISVAISLVAGLDHRDLHFWDYVLQILMQSLPLLGICIVFFRYVPAFNDHFKIRKELKVFIWFGIGAFVVCAVFYPVLIITLSYVAALSLSLPLLSMCCLFVCVCVCDV